MESAVFNIANLPSTFLSGAEVQELVLDDQKAYYVAYKLNSTYDDTDDKDEYRVTASVRIVAYHPEYAVWMVESDLQMDCVGQFDLYTDTNRRLQKFVQGLPGSLSLVLEDGLPGFAEV